MFLPLHPIVLIILGLPALFFLLYMNLATLSFSRLAVSQEGAFALFALSLMGSVINIPVYSRKVIVQKRSPFSWFFPVFYFYPPEIKEQVVAVNLGGAVIPVLFSTYLLPRASFGALVIATATVAAVSYFSARPVPGRGIVMPAFLPPLAAALSALLFGGTNRAVVAYISGTVGTLIGADLMHLNEILRYGSGILSIGGAGVYDGVFLAGLMAALLA